MVNDTENHINERFPDQKHAIDDLMAEDSEFRALCEDYNACVNALRYWAESKAPEAKTRVNEYRTLVHELEEEINQALITLKPRWLE
jgi:uncharacterized protein YdcH (DUF465 family)